MKRMMLDFPKEWTIREVLEIVPVKSYPANCLIVAIEMEEDICINELGIYAGYLVRRLDTGTSSKVSQLAFAYETGIRILERNL